MEIQERIKEKARELFMRFGFRAVTMDEIAAKMGASKKTIYQVYKDKDALVNAVIEGEISMDEKRCGGFYGCGKNALEEIILTFGILEDIFSNMNPVALYDLEKFYPAAFKKMEEHKHVFIRQIIKANIMRGIEEELYRNDIDIDILVNLRIANIFIVFDQRVFPGEKFNLLKTSKELLAHFIYGIVTPKGYKLFEKYLEQHNIKKKIV
jgi:AcrR family transcriptional regulator